MKLEIENTGEGLLTIEYNSSIYRISPSSVISLDADSPRISLSAYMEIPKDFDLDDMEGIKGKIVKRLFNGLCKISKKVIIQCKLGYNVVLPNDEARLAFSYQPFGKEQSLAEEWFEMPIELTSFARLECEGAEISVENCEVLNKKAFLRFYKLTYLWVNWGFLDIIFCLLTYIPSYIKQKHLVSGKRLTKFYNHIYSLPYEEREAALKFKEKNG